MDYAYLFRLYEKLINSPAWLRSTLCTDDSASAGQFHLFMKKTTFFLNLFIEIFKKLQSPNQMCLFGTSLPLTVVSRTDCKLAKEIFTLHLGDIPFQQGKFHKVLYVASLTQLNLNS